MQIWIYFETGVGGDGLANLFERADNVVPLDGDDCSHWRVHRWVDDKPKFWAPNFDLNSCFRSNPLTPFSNSNNKFTAHYLDRIKNQHTTIVTSHDITLDKLHQSDCLDVLTNNQVKVLVYTRNRDIAYVNGIVKNLQEEIDWSIKRPEPDLFRFDVSINIDKFQTDPVYATKVFERLRLDLNQQHYHDYLSLQQGNRLLAPFCSEEWCSNRTDSKITYTKISR
jgi:hypothetical protein